MIWIPPKPELKLNFIELELGGLKDCCELVSLKP